MASEPVFARAVNAPRGNSDSRPPDGVHGAVGFGRQRDGAALGREAAAGSMRPERCGDGSASSATSSAGLAAKGGGGVHDLRPGSVGNSSKSCRRQVSGAVHLGFRDGIRGGAAPGYRRRRRAQWWKTNFGNWVKFTPPPPKCVVSGAAQSVTVSSVARAGTVPSAGCEFSAAGAADGGCGPSGVAKAEHDRCDSVGGVVNGTVASGIGAGGGVLARAQAAMRVLWGSIAGVDQPLQVDHDIGVRGAAQAPEAGPPGVGRDVGGSEASTVAWAEEKAQLLSRVEELKREVAGLKFELKKKKARTRKENALMKKVLQDEHAVQVAELRSQAKAAWDAGAAQAAELATEQRITSELSHQVDLAEKEISDLKALLRSAVERA